MLMFEIVVVFWVSAPYNNWMFCHSGGTYCL